MSIVLEPGGTSVKATLGFSHEPDDVVVARGQSARLDCLVRLPPPVERSNNNNSSSSSSSSTSSSSSSSQQQQSAKHFEEPIAFDILWFQDGQPVLLPDQRRHLLANGSLYFDKVSSFTSIDSTHSPIIAFSSFSNVLLCLPACVCVCVFVTTSSV